MIVSDMTILDTWLDIPCIPIQVKISYKNFA